MNTSFKRCRQGRLRQVNPKKQAPGRRCPWHKCGLSKAPRVQLATEFDRISELPTSCQQQENLPSNHYLQMPRLVSSKRVGPTAGAKLAMTLVERSVHDRPYLCRRQ